MQSLSDGWGRFLFWNFLRLILLDFSSRWSPICFKAFSPRLWTFFWKQQERKYHPKNKKSTKCIYIYKHKSLTRGGTLMRRCSEFTNALTVIAYLYTAEKNVFIIQFYLHKRRSLLLKRNNTTIIALFLPERTRGAARNRLDEEQIHYIWAEQRLTIHFSLYHTVFILGLDTVDTQWAPSEHCNLLFRVSCNFKI